MPEIKNTFSQGKMNKDLDERIIPNGQYRDAMNVQVSTSEGSDIGTVQNILGNVRFDSVVDVPSAKCVGSISDEKNNSLYWFIKSDIVDAILEYTADGSIKAVLVDTKANTSEAVLKFTNNIITGINIIDNLLLWTDGTNEPKRINIERCKLGNENITSLSSAKHTKLIVNNETITKTMVAYADMTTSGGSAYTDITLQDVDHLRVGDKLTKKGGFVFTVDIVISSISGNIVSIDGAISPATTNPGDKFTFTRIVDVAEEHISSIKKKPLESLSIIANQAESENKNPLFEKVFPRFSYRYKYEDGEYSTYAPFTDVVFKSLWGVGPDSTIVYDVNNAYGTKEPYNNAMRNMLSSIDLKDFVSPEIPEDVVQIDLLYKQEDSNVIYILETVRANEEEWESVGSSPSSKYKGSFTVTNENIYTPIPENQLVRPWDNVPKNALAQEVTGNRVVYGNYKQGYDLPAPPKIVSDFTSRNVINDATGGLPSIKSQRDYQVGIVYGDKYGRETPVFTNENAALTVPWGSPNPYSITSQQLTASVSYAHPSWADYYKFFVKETSGEYYNLVMDAIYTPTKEGLSKEDHVWLSFASSDRNKVSEEDYIILKKKVGNSSLITEENKYRILDVKNEAPDSIKYKYLRLGEMSNANNELNIIDSGAAGQGIFPESTLRPASGKDFIRMSKTNWHNPSGFGASTLNPGMSLTINDESTDSHSLYIHFYKDETPVKTSDKFKISAIRISNNLYEIHLEKPLPDTFDNDFHDGSTGNLDRATSVVIEKKVTKTLESFSGRFFAKIFSKGIVSDLQSSNPARDGFTTTVQQKAHWHADTFTAGYDPDAGLVNSSSYSLSTLNGLGEDTKTVAGIGSDITNTETGWQNILDEVGDNKFFIDNMYMAASQPSNSFFARRSGQGWYGGEPIPVGDILYANTFLGQVTSFPSNYTQYAAGDSYIPISMQFPTNSDIKLSNVTTTNNGDNMVNGIPGIITTNNDHNGASGIRRWKDSIHDSNLTPNVYPTGNGKKVIHLSFLAPGEDLHDNTWSTLSNGEMAWSTIQRSLQGIWGGGVFTPADGGQLPTTSASNTTAIYVLGVPCERFAEYSVALGGAITYPNSLADGSQPARNVIPYWFAGPGYPVAGKILGYNINYKDRHEKQWKPEWSGGVYNSSVESFIDTLKTPGQKFRFKNDTTGHIYTIEKVEEKRIYNHTPWRRMYKHDYDTGDAVATGDSVEEAAIEWAQSRDSGGNKGGTAALRNAWKDKVVDFGKRNNRRVCYIIHLEDNNFPGVSGGLDPTDTSSSSLFNSVDSNSIEFVDQDVSLLDGRISENPAIWETEPKDNVDLDIYYETGQAYPTILTEETKELFASPECEVSFPEDIRPFNGTNNAGAARVVSSGVTIQWEGLKVVFKRGTSTVGLNKYWNDSGANESFSYVGLKIRFTKPGGGYTTGIVTEYYEGSADTIISVRIEPVVEVGLSWYNCFSFGNGIESDRIRDDFNAMTLSNGVRANSIIERPYTEEHRKNGLIYSGLYNSSSEVNNLNQFIMAEKITKDLNPTFGSIQKLFSRRISLIAFCEDRVVGITANKNALYNADGNPQIVASDAVLGDANPFVGDYGISKNPESFAKESYRAYFTDKQRGAVLRLSMDGLTPISDAGMHDYFRDNLKTAGKLIGTYDAYKNDYNVTLSNFLPNNIIANGFLAGEEQISTEYFDETEIVQNGNFTRGTAGSNGSVPENVALNSNIGSLTTITNYAEIPQYSLQSEQPAVATANWNWGEPVDPSWYIYYMDHDVSAVNPAFFDGGIPGDSTNINPQTTGQTTYTSIPSNNNLIGENVTATAPRATAVTWGGTVRNQGIIGHGYGNQEIPYLQNTTSADPGYANIRVNLNESNNLLAQQAANQGFPNAINTTIFHHEVYKIELEVRNYEGAANEFVDNAVFRVSLRDQDNNNLDENSFVLYTDANAILDSGITSSSVASSVSPTKGYVHDATVDFDITSGTTENLSFYFMIKGTEGTHYTVDVNGNREHLAPVYDDFSVVFRNVGDADNGNNYFYNKARLFIKNFKVKKLNKVITVGNTVEEFLSVGQPPQKILAWAKVSHHAINHWSGDSNLVLDEEAQTKYGPDTGAGDTETYDVYNSSGVVTGTDTYLKPPASNPNTTTTYNQYTTTTDVMDGNNVIGTQDDFLENGYVKIASGSGYLSQDITSDPLLVDNWYEVRLIGVTKNNSGGLGVLVSDALDPTTFPAGTMSGDTLTGHVGEVSGGSNTKVTFEDQGGDEWICRWKQTSTTDTDTLKLYFYNFQGTIDRIEFADITDKYSGGTTGNWHLQTNPLYHYYSGKRRVRWYNNVIRWGYDSHDFTGTTDGYVDVGAIDSDYARQTISTLPIVNDEYELRFQISLSDAGQGPGINTGGLQGYVTSGYEQVDPGHTYGFEFDGVTQGGYYRVRGNFDNTTTPTINRTDSTYKNIETTVAPITASLKDHSGAGHANKILFRPRSGSFFKGNLSYVSLRNTTNYFSVKNEGSWVFDGFDTTLENYINWNSDNQNIVFTDAPSSVSLRQGISNHNLVNGATAELKFTSDMSGGGIRAYFYNSDGNGFCTSEITTVGQISGEFVMGEGTLGTTALLATELSVPENEILRNTFVILLSGSATFSGVLDNFELYRIYPEFTPATVSYSEDVKGWTSFKSFIPESGVNISKEYYTFKDGGLYKHHDESSDRNTFYNGEFTESSITAVLNTEPSVVKIYNTLNYEGSQSRVYEYDTDSATGLSNVNTYNLEDKEGWYVEHITTDKQDGSIKEFIEKEGKWFNYIKGKQSSVPSDKLNKSLASQFSFQGLGMVSTTVSVGSNAAERSISGGSTGNGATEGIIITGGVATGSAAAGGGATGGVVTGGATEGGAGEGGTSGSSGNGGY